MQNAPGRLIDTLLLLALPASGKSETRRYLASLTPEQCQEDFHLGPTVQLDDYPYVHMMRRVSQELRRLGQPWVFFESDTHSMTEPRDWGMLIDLLNQDYDDLVAQRRHQPESAAAWLLDRYDAARVNVGARPELLALPAGVRAALCAALEPEARALLDEKNRGVPESLEGRTVVIEFARGGPDGSKMPITPPFGYQYSLAQLSPAILQRAAILYVWVTPEESRRKNFERTDPNDPGSILNHGVPLSVMLADYGCDDMEHLLETSDQPGTVRVEAAGQTYHLPVARFDNRKDKTSFVRGPRASWDPQDVDRLHQGLREALSSLVHKPA